MGCEIGNAFIGLVGKYEFEGVMMVEELEVKDWESYGYIPSSKAALFHVRVTNKSDFYEIAETLDLPYIFQKGMVLMCTDNVLLYWYEP